MLTHRGVEQLAARWAHNPKVGGSSPPPATNFEAFSLFFYIQTFGYYEKRFEPQILLEQ